MLEAAKAGLEKLHDRINDLEKQIHYKDMYISTLEAENTALKDNKFYETCDGCVHFGVRDGYKTCRSIHQCGIWYPNLKDVGNV